MMRIFGWSASAVGLVGVVTCTTLTPLIWVVRNDLAARSRKLWAIPESGLETASTLTDAAATWLGVASQDIRAIAGKAVDLARAPEGDVAAATDLAAAIDAFIDGPFASLRTVYVRLRERGLAVNSVLEGIRAAAPDLLVGEAVADLLESIDAQMQKIDASVTHPRRDGRRRSRDAGHRRRDRRACGGGRPAAADGRRAGD
jgi:hypothetical protein